MEPIDFSRESDGQIFCVVFGWKRNEVDELG